MQKDLSNGDYHERFNALVTAGESYGSSVGECKALEEELRLISPTKTMDNVTNAELEQYSATEKYLATMLMLNGANWQCFGKLRKDLDLDYAKGNGTYPKDRAACLHLLNETGENKVSSANEDG